MPPRYDPIAVLLMGGALADDKFYGVSKGSMNTTKYRALEYVDGKSLLHHALEQIHPLQAEKIVPLVPETQRLTDYIRDHRYSPKFAGKTMIATAKAGLTASRGLTKVLICDASSVITTEGLEAFLSQAQEKAAKYDHQPTVVLPIVPVDLVREAYPGLHVSSRRVAEGRFTLGSPVYIQGEIPRVAMDWIDAMYEHRKDIAYLAWQLGPFTALRIELARCDSFPWPTSIDAVKQRLAAKLHMNVETVIMNDPDFGADVDRYSDLEPMEQRIKQRRKARELAPQS